MSVGPDQAPKEVATLGGKVVARTFDVPSTGSYIVRFPERPYPRSPVLWHRKNYDTIRVMVERYYPGAVWEGVDGHEG
jgi:hypothetical protein